jgi:DNA repair exonuclease SbcCD nuclease subunit
MRIIKEKVCTLSDIHIGVHQASPMWHNISLDFAHWLKAELISRDIKDIIIPGDVLDDRNEVSVTTLHLLPQFFKILDCFNIIISVGNHDCYYSRRSDIHSLKSLDGWSNITIIDKPTTITAHEKIITFVPWFTPVESITESDIIFGHFDIQSFKMGLAKVCEHGIRSQDLLQKAKLVITGHYHLTQDRVYQNGTILYLGSPYELNWGEANTPKGFYIVDISTNKYEFIENKKSPKHRKVRLSELISLGKITDQIRDEFQGNIISFVVDVEAGQSIVDNLIQRFSLLKPLEMKIEYDIANNLNLTNNVQTENLGINIESDIAEFVKSLEVTTDKAGIISYLMDIYKRAEVLVK